MPSTKNKGRRKRRNSNWTFQFCRARSRPALFRPTDYRPTTVTVLRPHGLSGKRLTYGHILGSVGRRMATPTRQVRVAPKLCAPVHRPMSMIHQHAPHVGGGSRRPLRKVVFEQCYRYDTGISQLTTSSTLRTSTVSNGSSNSSHYCRLFCKPGLRR
jgi:hypothetical protein